MSLFFLISYPQIKKEEYNIITKKDIKVEIIFDNKIYSFSSRVIDLKANKKDGIVLEHTDIITFIKI